MSSPRFRAYCRRKEEEALSAQLSRLKTVAQDIVGADLIPIGSPWTRGLFDGEFYRSASSYTDQLPSISLFVGRSRSGHFISGRQLFDSSGETCRHLVHEGLSRVDVDAVLGSIGAADQSDQVFSVWHPEMVALRRRSGHPRHPVQVVISASGELPFDHCLLFQEPTLRVMVLTATSVVAPVSARLKDRPWIDVLDAGEPLSLFTALRELRARGLRVISAVGGVQTASALLSGGLVGDLFVTRSNGEENDTEGEFYDGPPLFRRRLLAKAGCDGVNDICFEHLVRPSIFSVGVRSRILHDPAAFDARDPAGLLTLVQDSRSDPKTETRYRLKRFRLSGAHRSAYDGFDARHSRGEEAVGCVGTRRS